MTGLRADEEKKKWGVVFSAQCIQNTKSTGPWLVPKAQKDRHLKAHREQRLNIQARLSRDLFSSPLSKARSQCPAQPCRCWKKLEAKNPTMTAIHVFSTMHATDTQEYCSHGWKKTQSAGKVTFSCAYAPHLNPINVSGVMHKCVTHNVTNAHFDQFQEAILGFFSQKPCPQVARFNRYVTTNFPESSRSTNISD